MIQPLTRQLLERLLERAERPNRQRVVRVRLDEVPAYGQSARDRIHADLEDLEQHGLIRLNWVKQEAGNWLDSIDLAPGQAPALNGRIGRTPREERRAALGQLLAEAGSQPGWHAGWLAWVRDEVGAWRVPLPFVLDDPLLNADLVAVLAAIAQLEEPTLERALSLKALGSSKRFEALRARVTGVLRRHTPDGALFGDDDDGLLAAHGVRRTPEHVLVFGGLVLEHRGSVVDLGSFKPSLGLAAPYLAGANVVRIAAQVLITVENLTSFATLAELRPDGIVGVYTGGFASPAVLSLLRKCREWPGVTHRHWGDLDAGGFRILAHLRRQLGAVEAWAMDVVTLEAGLAHAQPLTAAGRRGLQALVDQPGLADCRATLETLLSRGVWLEQEAVTPPG